MAVDGTTVKLVPMWDCTKVRERNHICWQKVLCHYGHSAWFVWLSILLSNAYSEGCANFSTETFKCVLAFTFQSSSQLTLIFFQKLGIPFSVSTVAPDRLLLSECHLIFDWKSCTAACLLSAVRIAQSFWKFEEIGYFFIIFQGLENVMPLLWLIVSNALNNGSI